MPRRIDHVVLCVADLARAAAFYRRLGFTLTRRAAHPWGTCNHLALLDGNFLELLAVNDPSAVPCQEPGRFSFGAYNQAYLGRREGMSMLVFAGSDAKADVRDWAASGLNTYEPLDFSREAPLPDGRSVPVNFSLAFVTHPEMTDAAFFSCHLHEPDALWNPEYRRHVNGARRLVEVVMSAPEPGHYRDFFARLTSDQVVVDGETLGVGPPSDRISVLSPAALAVRFPELPKPDAGAPPRFQAIRVTVSSLAAAVAVLERNDVPHSQTEGSIVIAPSDAFGVAVELVVG